MAIRTPQNLPKNSNKITRFEKTSRGRERQRSFVSADETRFKRFRRRVFRFLTHPAFFVPIITLTIGAVIALGYFWQEYSERVDGLLRGEIYTQSAGIYSAPKTLKTGEQISSNELASYLKSANYVEKNAVASAVRGRFSNDGNSLIIEPGSNSTIDGKQAFKPLHIIFSKDGKAVTAILNLTTNEKYQSALLEPKLLTSILGEDRERRKAVDFKDIPPVLVKAITTTEDRAFFEHYGVNLRGILRALWRRVDSENDNSPIANQGGSSITQQLVKNLLLSNEHSLTRKLQEAYMSVILETRLSKEKIFELYANQIYLGQQASFSINGVGEAANAYFGKDVSQLNLAESAFLAGIIRSPNRYNPYKNTEKVAERRNQVVDSMVEAGTATPEEAAAAKQTPLILQPPQKRDNLVDTPYFTEYAQEDLTKIIADPEAVSHLRIYTTLDSDLQRKAHDVMANRLAKLDKVFKGKPGLNASLVAIRPKTGEIVAMIGGRNYLENQFNRATDAQRQPGSVFKPFVYATAINTAYDPTPRVITAATIFKDEAKIFTFGNDSYKPNNYGDTFSNKDVTLRDALVKSKNVITVDLAMQLNVGKVMNLAAHAGLPKVPRAYPSMALGTAEVTPLQMAAAYTTFANLGQRSSPISINRVTTGDGMTVAAPATQKTDVLRPDVAYVMDDMLKDVVNRGTAAELRAWGFKNVPNKTGIAGKTGTSRDGWFAGFTPELVCVVYVGFDNGDDLGMKGADSAMPIWADFMKAALDAHPEWNGDWAMPAGISKAEIDIRNGQVINEKGESATPENAVSPVASPTPTSTPDGDLAPGDPDALPTPKVPTIVPLEFRRTELFIAGTIPSIITETPGDMVLEDPEVFPEPDASPTPLEQAAPESSPGEIYIAPDNPMRQSTQNQPTIQRTIILQICAETGLIAAPSCPHPRPKKFKLGEEPKEFCKPEYHQQRRQGAPQNTRPPPPGNNF
ncbi:MAG: PBP1A family penicillin-binding protein [Pyrinomonadaceae bacterium]